MDEVEIMVKDINSNETFPLIKFLETQSIEISQVGGRKEIVLGIDMDSGVPMGVSEPFKRLVNCEFGGDLSNN